MELSLFNGNWVDLVILIIIFYFIIEGFRLGFFVSLADFASFFISLLVALSGFSYLSDFLRLNFAIAGPIANMVSFLIISVLSSSVLNYLFFHLVSSIPKEYRHSRLEDVLSIFPSIGEALIICAFILAIVVNLPINPYYKDIAAQSRIGGILLEKTSSFNNKINTIFGKAVEETLTRLVIRQESKEVVSLSVASRNLTEDPDSARAMFELLNKARSSHGAKTLVWDDKLALVATGYAFDMWNRSFFGHYSPEGESVANRLDKAQIVYRFAGENLAMAPTVTIAQTGLMNSEGHRENILDENFKKVGIGVVDNKVYGKIFVQVFTD